MFKLLMSLFYRTAYVYYNPYQNEYLVFYEANSLYNPMLQDKRGTREKSHNFKRSKLPKNYRYVGKL